MALNAAIGEYGERVAARHLQSQGMVILDRNWRCADGEIDIVARDGPDLVICEVKTRSSVEFGTPLEAVTATKAARLRRLGACWVQAHLPITMREMRVDVVSVLRSRRGAAQVEHDKGVA